MSETILGGFMTVGETYLLTNKADPGRALNVWSNSTYPAANLSNVCLWTKDTNDTAQHWKLVKSGGHYLLKPADNGNVALDLYTGSGSGANRNAHLYTPSHTSWLTFELTADGRHIKIRLENTNKYLTANQNRNGTRTGTTSSAAGNVYFWQGGLTDGSQEWTPRRVGGGGTPFYSQNYLVYPCHTMNISQNYNGTYNHYLNSGGTPCDYPIDDICENTNRSWMFCPCDSMKVVDYAGVNNSARTNTIWLESTNPVVTPSGSFIVTMMVCHPEDEDLWENGTYKYPIGHIFHRGEQMFREGMNGWATGNHFHISVGKGHSLRWQENSLDAWVLVTGNGTIKPEFAFYIDPTFTTIANSGGIVFSTLPNT